VNAAGTGRTDQTIATVRTSINTQHSVQEVAGTAQELQRIVSKFRVAP